MSPYILEQFEKWAGYPFRPEYIVDQGYHNSIFRVPTKEFRDFIEFQQIEVSRLAKELVDIVHGYGKEAMMFLGDHWIGTEPFGKYFADIGLDAVVGSVGDGVTMRMISDIKGARYTEGRLLPYFFPDVFNEHGDPIGEAQDNWLKARRAILRSPLDRIGYGGYLKLAIEWPGFVDEIQKIVGEFRQIHENMDGTGSYMAPVSYTHLDVYKRQFHAGICYIRFDSQLIFKPVEIVVRNFLRFIIRRIRIAVAVQVAVMEPYIMKAHEAAQRMHMHFADALRMISGGGQLPRHRDRIIPVQHILSLIHI